MADFCPNTGDRPKTLNTMQSFPKVVTKAPCPLKIWDRCGKIDKSNGRKQKIFMKTDGIILDIDGTLWNSTDIVAASWNEAFRSHGVTDTTVTGADLRSLFGKTMDAIAAAIFPTMEEDMRLAIMDTCTEMEEAALERDPCQIFYPGVVETIRSFSDAGRKLFIVSNCQKGYIELVMEKGSFASCITDHLCFGDTGCGKAANMRTIVERNHLKRPVYVGDTEGDREASEEAGVPFIFVSYGFGSVTACAAEIKAFPDLMTLLTD